MKTKTLEAMNQTLVNVMSCLGAWHLVTLLKPYYGDIVAMMCGFGIVFAMITLQVLIQRNSR